MPEAGGGGADRLILSQPEGADYAPQISARPSTDFETFLHPWHLSKPSQGTHPVFAPGPFKTCREQAYLVGIICSPPHDWKGVNGFAKTWCGSSPHVFIRADGPVNFLINETTCRSQTCFKLIAL